MGGGLLNWDPQRQLEGGVCDRDLQRPLENVCVRSRQTMSLHYNNSGGGDGGGFNTKDPGTCRPDLRPRTSSRAHPLPPSILPALLPPPLIFLYPLFSSLGIIPRSDGGVEQQLVVCKEGKWSW